MKTRNINQKVFFKASPKEVYDALMDSRKHARFTQDKARISPKVGGRFSAYSGYITGINLELVQGRKIVQIWRASNWPEEHESRVTFNLKDHNGGTMLEFLHEDVPFDEYSSLKQGWTDFYWNPMKETFGW